MRAQNHSEAEHWPEVDHAGADMLLIASLCMIATSVVIIAMSVSIMVS